MATIAEIRKQYPQYNDMNDQQLADALHGKYYSDIPKDKYYSQVGINPEQKGFGAVASDIADLPGNLLNGLSDFAMETVSGLPEATDEVFSKELPRAIGNFGAGLATQGKSIVNLPYELQQYLHRKFGKSPDELTDRQKAWQNTGAFDLPHIPEDTGLEKALGLDERNPGDVTLRNLGMLFTPGAKAAKTETAGTITGRTIKGLEKELSKNEKALVKSEQSLNEAKEATEYKDSLGDIKNYLGKGQLHGSRFGQHANADIINKIEIPNKELYKKFQSGIKGHTTPVNAQELPLDQIVSGVLEKNPSGYINESEVLNKLQSKQNRLGNYKDIPTSDLVNLYRDTRDVALELKNSLSGASAIERPAILKDISRFENYKTKLDEAVDKSLSKTAAGRESLAHYRKAQHDFANKVAPTREDKLLREIRKDVNVKGNILEKIEGGRPGQRVLRNLIKENPELKRLVVGQSFADHPEKLFNSNEALNRHLSEMPELVDLLKKAEQKEVSEINRLKDETRSHGFTLQQKIEIENKIKEAQEKRSKIAKTIKRVGKWGVYAGAGAAGLGALGTFINKLLPPVNQ